MRRFQMLFRGGPRPKVAAVGCYRAAPRRATEPRLRVSAHSGDAPSAGSMMAQMSRVSATKAPHDKLAGSALMAPAFSHPATVLVAVKTKPAAAGVAGLDGHLRAAARALRRVGAEGWPRSNKRIGPCRRSRIASEASWARKELFRICTTEGNGTGLGLEWSQNKIHKRSSRKDLDLPSCSQNTLFTKRPRERIMNAAFAINHGENVMAFTPSLRPIRITAFLALSGGP